MSGADGRHAGWESLFWSVFKRSKNAMWLLDEQGVYLEVNPALCELLGMRPEELVGTSYGRLMAEPDRLILIDEWDELWKHGDWCSVRTMVRVDGSRVHLEVAARTTMVDGRPVLLAVSVRATPESVTAATQLGELTQREREIIGLIAMGQTSPEIAEHLVISPETVRTHVSNAMAKTGARTRAQLVAIALAEGYLTRQPTLRSNDE